MGTKKSVLVDGQGGPLGVTIAGANVLERKMLRDTIEAIVVERPEPTAEEPQNLSLDGGYNNPTGRAAAAEAGLQAASLGRGADIGLAVEVPGHLGAVRQEGYQLPRPDPMGLRAVLVSAAGATDSERRKPESHMNIRCVLK
jgi:hypothetical protein